MSDTINSPLELPPPLKILINKVDDFVVEHFFDESLIKLFEKKRSDVLEQWGRPQKIDKIFDFISLIIRKTPCSEEIDPFTLSIKNKNNLASPTKSRSKAKANNSTVALENDSKKNLESFYIYTPSKTYDEMIISGTKSPIITRENCEIGFERFDLRTNMEIDAAFNALIDYEILNYVYEKFQNCIGRMGRSIILGATEKLYYAIHLGLFCETDVSPETLFDVLNNLHVMNTNLFTQKPSMEKALNNYLVYWLNKNDSKPDGISFLVMCRRFLSYLNQIEFLPPENKSLNHLSSKDQQTYCSQYTRWFAVCVLPKFTKCFPLYKVTKIFGFEFLNVMLKFVKKDFKPPNVSESEIKLFFKRFEEEFLDCTLPFWNKFFRNNLQMFDLIVLYIQEKILSDNQSNENLQYLNRFYENFLNYKQSNDRDDQTDSSDINDDNGKQNVSCQFCDKDKFRYCFIHNQFNIYKGDDEEEDDKAPNEIILQQNTFPQDWIERFLIKLDNHEITTATFTTEKFDPSKLNLPESIGYLFETGDPENPSYRWVINHSLLSKVKRPMLIKYVKKAKPKSRFHKDIYSIFLKYVNSMANYQLVNKIESIGIGLESLRPNIEFHRLLYTSFVTNINTNMLSTMLSFLVGRCISFNDTPFGFDPTYKDTVQIVLIHNTLENEYQSTCIQWLIAIKNVFANQLPRMGKDYITRLVFDPRQLTLAVIKNGHKAIGGINFRPFKEQGFSEIVFCAVTSEEQIKGHGTRMMNRLKDYHLTEGIYFLLTYADSNAIGYFKKQGFTEDISLPKEQYHGYIKEYDGATLMECQLEPGISYNAVGNVLKMQHAIVQKMIEKKRKANEPPTFSFNFNADNRIIPKETLQKMFEKANIKCDLLSKIDFTDRSKELYGTFEDILNKLKSHQSAWPFLEPEKEASYQKKIKYPIDLSMMTERLSRYYYVNVYKFNCDMKRIFYNCRNFYDENTKQFKASITLERYYLSLMDQHGLDVDDQQPKSN